MKGYYIAFIARQAIQRVEEKRQKEALAKKREMDRILRIQKEGVEAALDEQSRLQQLEEAAISKARRDRAKKDTRLHGANYNPNAKWINDERNAALAEEAAELKRARIMNRAEPGYERKDGKL